MLMGYSFPVRETFVRAVTDSVTYRGKPKKSPATRLRQMDDWLAFGNLTPLGLKSLIIVPKLMRSSCLIKTSQFTYIIKSIYNMGGLQRGIAAYNFEN